MVFSSRGFASEAASIVIVGVPPPVTAVELTLKYLGPPELLTGVSEITPAFGIIGRSKPSRRSLVGFTPVEPPAGETLAPAPVLLAVKLHMLPLETPENVRFSSSFSA
ncbi:hypothetical protein D3C73_1067100 [compost metagenome]